MFQDDIVRILLREWASHMAMPVWIASEDEKLVYYNEAAEVLLGRRLDEAGEMPLRELPAMFNLTADDGAPLRLEDFPLAVAHRDRRPAHLRVRYQALDGIWRRVDVAAFPIERPGGHDLGAVAIFWEVPEP